MTIVMQRTSSAEYGKFIKALICGEPGSGKTLISSTFPNPFFASAEGGLMSIHDRDIPFTKIKESEKLFELREMLDVSPSARRSQFGHDVDTVVIDTIDEVQRVLIRERLASERKSSLALQDWGWLGEQMQAIVSGFRNLEMNVVFTCHLKETKDDELGRIIYKPGLQGAISDQIAGAPDLAMFLTSRMQTKVIDDAAQKVLTRLLISFPDQQHPWVKDRSGKLPAEFNVNFEDDFKRLHNLIYKDVKLDEIKEKALAVQPVVEPVEEQESPAESAGVLTPEHPASSEEFACTSCGEIFHDEDQATLSKIRARAVMCGPCYKEHLADKTKVKS